MDQKELTKNFGIAITGGIACGKSTVAEMLRQRAYLVIDADQIARSVLAPGSLGLVKVQEHFGSEILNEDGSLNRPKMRDLISRDPLLRRQLESITHPLIHQATFQQLRDVGLDKQPRLWFYEAALIFEKGREDQFKEVWACHCPKELQISRLMKRDQCTKEEALAMISSQMDPDKKRQLAQYTINTAASQAEMEKSIAERLEQLTI